MIFEFWGEKAGLVYCLKNPTAKILFGDTEAFQNSIHRATSMKLKQRWTGGCISFRHNEKPTPAQLHEILEDFKATIEAGLPEGALNIILVEHNDKDHFHVHFLISHELEGRSFTPYLARTDFGLFDDLKNITNRKFQWKDPCGEMTLFRIPKHIPQKVRADLIDLRKAAEKGFKDGVFSGRSELLRYMDSVGLDPQIVEEKSKKGESFENISIQHAKLKNRITLRSEVINHEPEPEHLRSGTPEVPKGKGDPSPNSPEVGKDRGSFVNARRQWQAKRATRTPDEVSSEFKSRLESRSHRNRKRHFKRLERAWGRHGLIPPSVKSVAYLFGVGQQIKLLDLLGTLGRDLICCLVTKPNPEPISNPLLIGSRGGAAIPAPEPTGATEDSRFADRSGTEPPTSKEIPHLVDGGREGISDQGQTRATKRTSTTSTGGNSGSTGFTNSLIDKTEKKKEEKKKQEEDVIPPRKGVLSQSLKKQETKQEKKMKKKETEIAKGKNWMERAGKWLLFDVMGIKIVPVEPIVVPTEEKKTPPVAEKLASKTSVASSSIKKWEDPTGDKSPERNIDLRSSGLNGWISRFQLESLVEKINVERTKPFKLGNESPWPESWDTAEIRHILKKMIEEEETKKWKKERDQKNKVSEAAKHNSAITATIAGVAGAVTVHAIQKTNHAKNESKKKADQNLRKSQKNFDKADDFT